jgi:hypothetical protein
MEYLYIGPWSGKFGFYVSFGIFCPFCIFYGQFGLFYGPFVNLVVFKYTYNLAHLLYQETSGNPAHDQRLVPKFLMRNFYIPLLGFEHMVLCSWAICSVHTPTAHLVILK